MKLKYIIIGVVILAIIVGIIFIKSPFKQEAGIEEKKGERLEPKFSFVEGDSESWDVQSSKMGEYVLSPSWFRFEYEIAGSALICRQFGSLEDAKNNINQLSEIKKEPIEESTGSYTLVFGEKGMEETLVNINVAIANIPPEGYAIYKYELIGKEVSEEKGDKKDDKESKEPLKETKQEETLTPEQEEIIEFLEAEDEQFDYPAVNKIRAGFRVNYGYDISGNSFTNKEVAGYEHLETDLRNLEDESGESIIGLGLTFITDLVAPNWRKQESIKIGPPIYIWAYDDFPQEEVYIGGGFRPEAYVEFSNQLISFTPGFDASRSADKTVFSGPGTQTLTITFTPREENIEKKSDGIYMNIYTVEPGAENLVDAIIISPTSDGEHIEVSEDRRSLRVYEQPVKTNVPWSITLTIEVTPKPEISKAEFLPFVGVSWNLCSFSDPYAEGTTTGSSVSCPANSVGTWKWKAKGNYIWEWEDTLCGLGVAFKHLQERVEDE